VLQQVGQPVAAQRVVCGTLATLPERADAAGLQSPCLIIVGEVVRLREQLAWFGDEREPLALAALG